MKKFICSISLTIFVLILCGYKENLQIEQEISPSFYQENEIYYSVTTMIWVKNLWGQPRSLPYYKYVSVPEKDLEIIKKLELQKAKAVEKRIGEKYEMLSREE